MFLPVLLLRIQADAADAAAALAAVGAGSSRQSSGRLRAQGKRGFEALSPAALYRLLQSGDQEVGSCCKCYCVAAAAFWAAAALSEVAHVEQWQKL